MANKEIEKSNVTGLDQASDRKEAEFNLVEALLSAAEYRDSENNITEAEIKRNGKYLFSVNIHPIGDDDTRTARKKATIYMPNPENKKLPPVEKDFNNPKFKSWVIYLATVEADQEKIWGNPQIMRKYGLMEPQDSIDILLTVGEKNRLFELVTKISGIDDDDEYTDEEKYAKN